MLKDILDETVLRKSILADMVLKDLNRIIPKLQDYKDDLYKSREFYKETLIFSVICDLRVIQTLMNQINKDEEEARANEH